MCLVVLCFWDGIWWGGRGGGSNADIPPKQPGLYFQVDTKNFHFSPWLLACFESYWFRGWVGSGKDLVVLPSPRQKTCIYRCPSLFMPLVNISLPWRQSKTCFQMSTFAKGFLHGLSKLKSDKSKNLDYILWLYRGRSSLPYVTFH